MLRKIFLCLVVMGMFYKGFCKSEMGDVVSFTKLSGWTVVSEKTNRRSMVQKLKSSQGLSLRFKVEDKKVNIDEAFSDKIIKKLQARNCVFLSKKDIPIEGVMSRRLFFKQQPLKQKGLTVYVMVYLFNYKQYFCNITVSGLIPDIHEDIEFKNLVAGLKFE